MSYLSTYILMYFLTTARFYIVEVNMLDKTALEIYIEESKPIINQRYKLDYHITPPVGWMNGPNGFLFFREEYHVFYQFYPYDTQWGPLHWGHVASSNLVDWRLMPTALQPGKEQCSSGSAIDNNGIMILVYTARETREDAPFYNESQYLAYSIDGVEFHKYADNPLGIVPPNGTQDFRDPKVWQHGDYWYIVIGSKSEDQKGAALLYKSADMISWEFQSVLAKSNGDLGHTWGNPDFFEMNGKYILLISPQGMEDNEETHRNTYRTGYILGNFSYKTCEFKQETGFQELDNGHDFYSTQTTERDGKRYLVAWLGMWESAHPEDADGWVGAMTIIRELDLIGTRIVMNPVEAMTNLRQDIILEGKFRPNSSIKFEKTGEIVVIVDLRTNIELEFVGANGGEKMSVHWNVIEAKVIVNRAGDIRQQWWEPKDTGLWRIFLDASSIELFCGYGEAVFSSRMYPAGDWRVINKGRHSLQVVAYSLRKSIFF